jgi:hypothetical protein
VFATLSAGATLVLRTDALLESMPAFAAGVEQMGITHLDLPTAFWNEWVVALTAGQAHILPGWPPSSSVARRSTPSSWPSGSVRPPDVRLFNTYGPTETNGGDHPGAATGRSEPGPVAHRPAAARHAGAHSGGGGTRQRGGAGAARPAAGQWRGGVARASIPGLARS